MGGDAAPHRGVDAVRSGIATAFADRNFRRYSLGSAVSWLSFYVQVVAVGWTAWELTHSARWLAIVSLADAVPNILLTPLGGVIADRCDRLRILLTSYAAATLHAALLAGLAYTGRLTLIPLVALAVLHGAIHAFSVPAAFGLLPRFIERRSLAPAIAVASAYTQLGMFVGPAVAGWIIADFGTATAFATNVAGYCAFFACVAFLRTPAGYRQQASSRKAFMSELAQGLRAITAHRGIAAILVLMLFGDALAAAVRQMMPAFADQAFGAGVHGLSVLLACMGIGATLSALWLAQGGTNRASPKMIVSAFPAFLIAVAWLTLARHLGWAAAAMLIVGCSFELCRTGTVALLQLSVPDELRGRIMSLQALLVRLAGSLGVAVAGALTPGWGLRQPILLGAVTALLVWAAVFRRRGSIASSFQARRA